MEMLFLVPKPGLRVVMPDGDVFPDEGNFILRDAFIDRRIADGDLIAAPPPVVTPQKKGS
jgi:Protein of unknown function (DUF2635)